MPEVMRVVPFREREIEFKNFNLVFGANASGKTMLLRKFSEYTSFPILSLNSNSLNSNLSGTTAHLEKIYDVISKYSELELPLLLDNIRWNAMDSRNKIRLIDKLFEHSVKEQVIVTACQ